MTNLLVIAILLVVFFLPLTLDFLFAYKINNFIRRAEELSQLYYQVNQSLANGNTSVIYEGTIYNVTVNNRDYESFISQIEEIVNDVLKSYDNIENFFLEQMDSDLERTVYQLHTDIENIKNAIRIVKWQNGFKK